MVVEESKKSLKSRPSKRVSLSKDVKSSPERPAAAESAKTTKKKTLKSKSLRKLRGMISGESRRERRAKRKVEREARIAQGVDVASLASEMDEESVYSVDFDGNPSSPARSMLGGNKDDEEYHSDNLPSPSLKDLDPLQVLLLLMDPKTRRFELLQLEFDSHKAIAADVLAQIEVSSTEESFRKIKYVGVCDRSGLELIKSLRLSDFVNGNDVLIAMPVGMTAKEASHLAKPILGNERVTKLLRRTGIIEPSSDAPPAATPASNMAVARKTSFMSSVGATLLSVAILVCMLGVLLQAAHLHMSAPLGPGHMLKPGASRAKCGLLSLVPMVCENSSLEMSENGVLTMVGPDEAVEWKIVGGVCRPGEDTSGGSTSCTDGLVVTENGGLEIGGRSVTSVTVVGGAPMTPWPFVENPRLRVIRGKK